MIILSAASVSGEFTAVTGLPAGWKVEYGSTTVKLVYDSTLPVTLVEFNAAATDGGSDFSGGPPQKSVTKVSTSHGVQTEQIGMKSVSLIVAARSIRHGIIISRMKIRFRESTIIAFGKPT